jgi:hypothetical protein
VTRDITAYILTLLSAYIVFFLFGTLMTVSAGPTNYLPVISFWGSVFFFGIGSWLFLHFAKAGRSLGIILALVTILWPIASVPSLIREPDLWGFIFFGTPIGMTALVIYAHIKRFNRPGVSGRMLLRFALSIVPFGIMVAYLIYLQKLGYFG